MVSSNGRARPACIFLEGAYSKLKGLAVSCVGVNHRDTAHSLRKRLCNPRDIPRQLLGC